MKALLTVVCGGPRRVAWPMIAGYCVLVLGGCSRARANVTPDQPALVMPEPPPRDVEPMDAEMPAPMSLPEEPAHSTPPRTRAPARSDAPRIEPKPEAPKPEAPIDPAKAAEEARPAAPVSPPTTTLQTTPAAAEGEMERSIRATLGHASADLNRVDYRVLNADARTQYDTAKNFIRQAETAMGAKNLAFAKTLAEKSAVLAAQLAGR